MFGIKQKPPYALKKRKLPPESLRKKQQRTCFIAGRGFYEGLK